MTEGGCWWLADFLWKWDTAYTREHATKKMGNIGPKLSMLPSEYIDRNVKIGSSNTRRRETRGASRSASTTSCGGRLPASRRNVAAHEGVVPRDVLGLPGRGHPPHPRLERPEFSDSTSTSSPLVKRIGPTPEEFGQVDVDMTIGTPCATPGRHWLTGKETIPGPWSTDGVRAGDLEAQRPRPTGAYPVMGVGVVDDPYPSSTSLQACPVEHGSLTSTSRTR